MKSGIATVLTICSLCGALSVFIPYATSGVSAPELDSSNVEPAARRAKKSGSLLIAMTANIAHGRGTGRHQALLSHDAIRSNLDELAQVFVRERPDVVAIQEADGPSFWSGGFSHVEYLSREAGLPHHVRGEHVKGSKLSYGTALLCQSPLKHCGSLCFTPSPPTLSKGYVVSRIEWPGNPRVKVTVVSVHLDFSRVSVRTAQVEEMIRTLSRRERPMIIMGDFNCNWTGQEQSLRTLADGLKARVYQPADESLWTFVSSRQRLDWILISDELEFVHYETITDEVSDHRGVIASLRLRQDR